MRIGLIGDTHGFLPALEAAVEGCKDAGVDAILHCGDFLTAPFSPDPHDESIALLRAEGILAVYGNAEAYLMHWGTEAWETTLAQRLRRPDKPGPFIEQIAEGQASISADALAWLRTVPAERTLDCARPNDVYMCHAMPDDPFTSLWDTDAQFTPVVSAAEVENVLSRPAVAGADLILCGHIPYPLVLRQRLPNERTALVVRGTGFLKGNPDGSGWMIDYWILENRGPAAQGCRAWEMQHCLRPFKPRNLNAAH